MKKDVVIVGGGPAGIVTATTAKKTAVMRALYLKMICSKSLTLPEGFLGSIDTSSKITAR